MTNGIKTVYPYGLNKRLGLKFCEGSQIQNEGSWRAHWLKCVCLSLNKDEDNSLNTLNNIKLYIYSNYALIVRNKSERVIKYIF